MANTVLVEILLRLIEVLLGLFGFSALIVYVDLRYTTKRLKRHVLRYLRSVEFDWRKESDEFVLMYKVRAFELLLRNMRAIQPTTPWANERADEIRDAVEFFHRGATAIFRGEVLPLPNAGEFPLPDNRTETHVRETILENLRKIKWLGLQELTEKARARNADERRKVEARSQSATAS